MYSLHTLANNEKTSRKWGILAACLLVAAAILGFIAFSQSSGQESLSSALATTSYRPVGFRQFGTIRTPISAYVFRQPTSFGLSLSILLEHDFTVIVL